MHPSPARPHSVQLATASLDTDRMNALLRANRSLNRLAEPAHSPSATAPATRKPAPVTAPKPTATVKAAPKPAVKPVPKATVKPVPKPAPRPAPKPAPKPSVKANPASTPLPHIRGLSANQVKNAWAVVWEGHKEGISPRGQIIAMATALQESQLINYMHAVDHDSLGIFQQRPSCGWGTRKQITTPTYAAHAFYRVLVHYKSSWGNLTVAAQKVQRSAYPGAYAKHERFATQIVTLLNHRF